MDRYNDVKRLLKNWEQEFVKKHQKKPDKEDIDQAPEETRKLYKEYRCLKKAKENSGDGPAGCSDLSTATPEVNMTRKESDIWGEHLNRRAQLASSPQLMSQDRDSLKASAQYYGLKLKSNLVALSKEKPAFLKKSKLSGRLPLNSLKDQQTAQGGNSEGQKASLAPLPSPVHQPVEPEHLFEPSEPLRESCVDPADATSVLNVSRNSSVSKIIRPQSPGASSPASSPARPSVLLSSLPSAGRAGVSAEGVGLREIPQVLGGFRGGTGSGVIGGKPSPASRFNCIDRKWLERCQVFGEMEVEVKPGAGNQDVSVDKGEETGRRKEVEGKTETVGKEVQESDGTRTDAEELRSDKESKSRKSEIKRQRVEEKESDRQREERGRTSSPAAEGASEANHKSKGAKKGGRKRQREGANEGGEKMEEGGVKKRRRCSIKTEESLDGNADSAREGKKRQVKKKGDEEGDTKEKKEMKAPIKENLFGETEEEFETKRMHRSQPVRPRNPTGTEGNYVKINLKKKSHVKGYALRGVGLRKQLYMQKFQLKGERFGGGGGNFGKGRRGGFRGGHSRHGDTCYKCGGTGHWAINCKGRAPPPHVSEEPPADEEPFELPTLEEVARATGTLRPEAQVAPPSASEEQLQDEVLLNVTRPDYERPAPPAPVEPLYDVKEDGRIQETPAEVYAALRDLGYQTFRPGQEEAIMRILSGLSTLVVLSTGMGKSLCYQLPAYLYAQRSKTITLVISPLVSLMDDQLSGLPANLKAACIHSNMTMKQREAAIEKVKSGQVCVLLLSPEALVGGGGSGSGCLPSAQELPPVAFACIDEAHCVSEWSHNFRPCYLRLCKVLRERLGIQCLLGLTATATLSTALDVARHLDINDQDGIAVRSAAVPPNLHLSVSMDREKDGALVSLLKGDRFGCLDSIIVYCTRREETVRVAALLRTCLQGVLLKENEHTSSEATLSNPVGRRKKELARKKLRKPLKWQAESYHAGLSASERRRVQNNFMCGQLRMVVATVAFGMGLDKPDVRGIIHYNMPKSFESYVQEIGRAGRDGEPAHCHLFLDPEGADLHELRRHIYADTVDFYTVKKLVQQVFPPCKCRQIHQKQQQLIEDIGDTELLEMMNACEQESSVKDSSQQDAVNTDRTGSSPAQEMLLPDVTEDEKEVGGAGDWLKEQEEDGDWPGLRVCHTHERAIPIQRTVEALDITEEGLETLLCYLELHPQRFVELLHPTLSVCKVRCYDGPRQLHKVTKVCPPVAVVLARRRMAGERVEMCDGVEFDVVEVADTMGWELPLVKRGLRQLQWSSAGGRSGVHVEFSALSFHFRSYGDLSNDEMDRVCRFLHNRVQDRERTQLYQLTSCFKAFKGVAFKSVASCVDDLDESRSHQLKLLLSEYFDKRREQSRSVVPDNEDELDKRQLADWENQIRADIRSFLANRSDEKFSGRAVARILHGIGSPCYPAQTYGRDRRYWRKHLRFDFNRLIQLATQEIIGFK